METKRITLEDVYYKLILLEKALRKNGIAFGEEPENIAIDDEGELRDEVKAQLELARKTPLSEYIDHEEVKKRILRKIPIHI